MADRPNSFNTTIPSGASSPRTGDDEIRRIKTYTQNAYNDLTQPDGVGISRTDLYGTTITGDSFVGPLTGNVTGDVTGNADTATTLETTRNIGGVEFNGSSDINLPGVNTIGNQDTTGNAATATALETERTISLSGSVTGSVSFDGTGNVNIETNLRSGATIPGNVETAERWDTERTVTLTGAVTGSTMIDGSQNVSITTAVGTFNASDIDDVTATAAEINRLDLGTGEQLGIIKVEATSSGNPVLADFTGNTTLIGQY